MNEERSQTALVAYLDKPGVYGAFHRAQEELSSTEVEDLLNLAVAAMCAGMGVSCSFNVVPHCNIQSDLAKKVPSGSGFVLLFYRDLHYVGLKVITLYGVVFDKVVKCGSGVLKPLLESAVEVLSGLDPTTTDKPQFVGWAMRQFPLPCGDWDVAT